MQQTMNAASHPVNSLPAIDLGLIVLVLIGVVLALVLGQGP